VSTLFIVVLVVLVFGLYGQTRELKAQIKTLTRYHEVATANMYSYKAYADKYDNLLSVLVPGGRRYGDAREGEAAIEQFVKLAKTAAFTIDGISAHYRNIRTALANLPVTAGLVVRMDY
jgi:hypothetical protein